MSRWLPLRKPAAPHTRAPRRFARTGFAESTLAEIAWQRTRGAGHRWAWAGAAAGVLLGLVAFAPAAWLAGAVARASGQQLLLSDARGTLWSGSAVPVLTGGAGSADASALPGRLRWTLRPQGLTLALRLQHACCLNGEPVLRLVPGFGRWQAELAPGAPTLQPVGQWPAAWLAGLGTPWNTLQLGGELRLAAQGLRIEAAQGRLHLAGTAQLDLLGATSRLATLEPLGDYRISLQGGDAARVTLQTLGGALRLDGAGQWGANGLRFRGEASAVPGTEPVLNNLLNIIGRRQGARSVIAIG